MRNIKGHRRQSAFTLIELVVTITVLGILGFTALSRFTDVHDAAHEAVVDGVVASLRSGASLYRSYWFTQGSPPGNNVELVVDGIPVRYRDGQVFHVNDANHIPAGTPNQNAASTRIFFLFLAVPPTPIIRRNSVGETGWVMLANRQCALPLAARPRCWEYRVNGNPEATITYAAGEDGRIFVH